jgi:hypothetical protein
VVKDNGSVWMVMEDSELGGSVPNVRENLILEGSARQYFPNKLRLTERTENPRKIEVPTSRKNSQPQTHKTKETRTHY